MSEEEMVWMIFVEMVRSGVYNEHACYSCCGASGGLVKHSGLDEGVGYRGEATIAFNDIKERIHAERAAETGEDKGFLGSLLG